MKLNRLQAGRSQAKGSAGQLLLPAHTTHKHTQAWKVSSITTSTQAIHISSSPVLGTFIGPSRRYTLTSRRIYKNILANLRHHLHFGADYLQDPLGEPQQFLHLLNSTFAIAFAKPSATIHPQLSHSLLQQPSSEFEGMPCKAEGLVLTVDPNVIHKVDTNNPQNLFSMWTVFSRCADSVEQGRRLENLSWRLWNRETFCCEAKGLSTVTTTTLPKDIPAQQQLSDLPQLSGSVDSIADEEAIDFTTISDPVEILRPRIVRQDSCASSRSRGRERHITSDHLEKMVVSIIQEKEPNLAPLPDMSSPSVESSVADHMQSSSEEDYTPTTQITESACESVNASSESSSQSKSAEVPATTVIRGFSPSQIPSFRVSHEPKPAAQDPIPEPRSSPAHKPVQPKKQGAMFKIGDSSSNESSPQSLDTRKPMAPPAKRPMFEVGVGSSGEDEGSLKSAMHSSRQCSLLTAQKKQASFNNHISTRTIQTPSDQSDSYMDESAIDDDDEDSEWEDSIEESGKSSVDDAVTFKRVPSKPNLTSQRSLISLMFAGQEERVKGLSNYASHSTPAIPQRARTLQNPSNMHVVSSPNDSDNGLEMRRGVRPTPLKPITEIPRSSAQPIMTNPQIHHHQAALSPRTTRRNMLATELTESLRRQLLWERQQKTSTANAVLKRRHTSLDVANLKQYPEKAYMAKGKEEPNSSSWNQYFSREDFGGYHAQGW
ncbi:DUF1752-domain-containing protein [Annulohypoxylon maeteangense]|uniref:DUF1752-domain-containing protein n=1 Tax=Annulohypoxylon maeteangense TaxID=1927788 RepID=UPI0020087251|nr:DUF1752-domain-containing protein [Annulohypoxylon maeteangense]KAI0888009.1 DUF1752-domain-containing protein [Annulohypoxylon maeteangense]